MKNYLVWILVFMLAGCQPVQLGQPFSPLAQVSSPLPSLPGGLVYHPVNSASGPQHRNLLPLIAKPGECSMGTVSSQIAELFEDDPGQHRVSMVCDLKLVQAAQHRADDMNARHYFAHTDPDGHTPNFWARNHGCNLPSYYPTEGNNIESIALNYPTAMDTWQGWLNSPAHRVHVLGEDPFFSVQVRYGVGYSPGPWGIVYVLLTSPSC